MNAKNDRQNGDKMMAGMKNNEMKLYDTALYCRLSKDDGTDEESASIATQKSILTDYVKQKGWHIVEYYIDDGYSGTNFNRPNFQRMIKDIEAGKINCVVTKDLSRLGRNYLDCGLYLEVFFPEHNVRYIAVNDGVDTLTKSAMDITPFKNILNEMYAADISTKIKSAKRARFNAGKFMGTHAPYGYSKDPNDRNHLIIDEKVAPVVRKMFELALAGNGIAKIRHYLNEHHVMRPAAYTDEKEGKNSFDKYFENDEENKYRWSENGVRGVLRSPVYAGHLTGYKRIAASMKSKKRPSTLPEEWEVIPNTHEAIVSQEDFDIVQKMMTSRRRDTKETGFDNIFAGIMFCADCGYAMRASSAHRRKRDNLIDCITYTCNNYGRYGNINCTSHTLEARDIYETVLAEINRMIAFCKRDENAIKILQKKISSIEDGEEVSLKSEKRKISKRLAELDTLYQRLFEDKVLGKIPERNFDTMSEKYLEEQNGIVSRIAAIDTELKAKGKADSDAESFVALIKNYDGLTELNATVVNDLIDKILISERTKNENGEVEQVIKIFYKFVGNIPGDLHIPPRKRYAVLYERSCLMCGETYLPQSSVQKYCPSCQVISHQQQAVRANKKRSEKRRQDKIQNGLVGYHIKTCAMCGAEFKPNSGNQKYCGVCVTT